MIARFHNYDIKLHQLCKPVYKMDVYAGVHQIDGAISL
jgi:hypothetical protein